MQLLKLHRHLIRSGLGLIISFSLLLTSCGGGGGSSTPPPPPPLIEALLFSLPTGSTYPASFANAMVIVLDGSTGASITTASVTMNGVALTYNSALSHQEYEGNVLVDPGMPVNLVVNIGGRTYTASGTQFAASYYPSITEPVSGDSWSATNVNTVSWTGGTPPVNAVYLLGILDAADPSAGAPYFDAFTTNPSPYSIPAYTLAVGNHYVIVGTATIALISNANASSYFMFGGFNYAPVNVYTWTSRYLGGIPLKSVAWSGTNYVAVGGSSAITSTDGVHWTTNSLYTANTLSCVIWDGTQFVAVGDAPGSVGAVLTSQNGVAWTPQNVGVIPVLYGIAKSESTLVAVGYGGTIVTSSNGGQTWTPRTSNTSNDLDGVTCNGANCVAVGLMGTILASSNNGASWSSIVPGTSGSPSLYSVAYSGNNYTAVGESGIIRTSADGANWTTSSAGTNSLFGITWTGTQFVAVGYPASIIYTSPDGVTWTAQTTPAGGYLYGVTSSSTQIVAVGNSLILTSP